MQVHRLTALGTDFTCCPLTTRVRDVGQLLNDGLGEYAIQIDDLASFLLEPMCDAECTISDKLRDNTRDGPRIAANSVGELPNRTAVDVLIAIRQPRQVAQQQHARWSAAAKTPVGLREQDRIGAHAVALRGRLQPVRYCSSV